MKLINKLRSKMQNKFIFALLLLTIVLIIVLGNVISSHYRNSMEAQYSEAFFNQAKVAAEFIDGDAIEKYYTTLETDDYYNEVLEYLQNTRSISGFEYLYVVVPQDEDMYYIWDSGDPDDEGVCELGDADLYYGGGEEVMKQAFDIDNTEDVILITNNDEYGYLASAYVPILDSDGIPVALVGVDGSMDEINETINNFMLIMIILIAAVLFTFIVIYYIFVQKTIIIPIKKLSVAASTIVSSQKDSMAPLEIDIITGDEIEELANDFVDMNIELRKYIQDLSAVTAEKERIGAELNVAQRIQENMLPKIFPTFADVQEFDVFASMTPAKEVGGDFYDLFYIDKTHLAVVVADVSGKGIPASLFMVISKTLIKNEAKNCLSPKQILENVNVQLCENNESEMFVTVWMGILDTETGKMVCTNAGHEYPVLKQGDNFEILKDKHGFVVAGFEFSKYSEYEIQLNSGDEFFVYTDGVAEATSAEDELFGMERTVDALNSNPDASPEQRLLDVKSAIDKFVKTAPQFDDITMVCLKFK